MRLVSGYICEGLSRLSKLRWEDPSWLWRALYQRLEQGKVSWASALIAFGLRQRQMQSISCFPPFPTKTDFQNNWAKRKPPFLRLLFLPNTLFLFLPDILFQQRGKYQNTYYKLWYLGQRTHLSDVFCAFQDFLFCSPPFPLEFILIASVAQDKFKQLSMFSVPGTSCNVLMRF